MPRAEIGSTKHLSNQLKSKGLQRLRWYCQVCERQMRDENGFKCHTQSESHIRQMLIVGEDPKKAIAEYSKQFQNDFLTQLRTSHGEKKVNVNHFYQEYIRNKEHVHMNATRWTTLTEFAKFLGREGQVRVEGDEESGIMISYIDRSPEALKRQEAIKRRDRLDKGDEEREQRQLQEQVLRAHADKAAANAAATATADGGDPSSKPDESEKGALVRPGEGEKVKLSFGAKPQANLAQDASKKIGINGGGGGGSTTSSKDNNNGKAAPPKKPMNVFAAANKKLGSSKKSESTKESKKPMSEAERIMKQELERKRSSSGFGGGGISFKKQKVVDS